MHEIKDILLGWVIIREWLHFCVYTQSSKLMEMWGSSFKYKSINVKNDLMHFANQGKTL